jgi:hypothetical protein
VHVRHYDMQLNSAYMYMYVWCLHVRGGTFLDAPVRTSGFMRMLNHAAAPGTNVNDRKYLSFDCNIVTCTNNSGT